MLLLFELSMSFMCGENSSNVKQEARPVRFRDSTRSTRTEWRNRGRDVLARRFSWRVIVANTSPAASVSLKYFGYMTQFGWYLVKMDSTPAGHAWSLSGA